MEIKRELILNGNDIISKEHFHKVIGEFFEIEGVYGENLDALWDVLSTVRGGKIIWLAHEESIKYLGDYFFKIVNIFKEVSLLKNHLEFELI